MSMQDDIFDVEAAVKGTPEAKAFDRIYTYLGNLEREIEVLQPKVRVIEDFARLLRG